MEIYTALLKQLCVLHSAEKDLLGLIADLYFLYL